MARQSYDVSPECLLCIEAARQLPYIVTEQGLIKIIHNRFGLSGRYVTRQCRGIDGARSNLWQRSVYILSKIRFWRPLGAWRGCFNSFGISATDKNNNSGAHVAAILT